MPSLFFKGTGFDNGAYQYFDKTAAHRIKNDRDQYPQKRSGKQIGQNCQ